MMKSGRSAWERLPGESLKAFNAFQTYLRLGQDRAIDLAHATAKGPQSSSKEKNQRASGHWFAWAEQFDWVARAGAHDDHIARAEFEAREGHVRALAAEWADREAEIREGGYNLARTFLERCKQMLEFPLEETTDVFEEGGRTIIRTVRPGNWNLATAAKFLDTAYRTASLSAGMETERIAASIQMREQNAAILQAMKESLAEVIGGDAIFVKVLERLEQKIRTIEQQ
jgi:hypothetical protein